MSRTISSRRSYYTGRHNGSTSTSSSFAFGVLFSAIFLLSVFFLLYSNKTATNGYQLRNLQSEQASLTADLEKWNNIEIKNDVISGMSKSNLSDTMSRPITITQIKKQQVAQR